MSAQAPKTTGCLWYDHRAEDAAKLAIEAAVHADAVTLGKGKRLFGDGTPTTMLKMIDHKVTAKGTVIATYEHGSPLPAFSPFGRRGT
jgi:hypothetical protein